MTVAETTALRRMLGSSAIDYSVVKNTLAKIASKETSFSSAADVFKGPVGLAIGYDDPVLAVKKVLEFVKTNEKLQVRGAVVDGQLYGPSDLKAIAALPSRETLLSMLAGASQAPAAKLAGALSATVSGFGYALESLKSKKNN
jgi:large subunit ribosomal protein L10